MLVLVNLPVLGLIFCTWCIATLFSYGQWNNAFCL